MTDELQHAVVTTVEIGALSAYERPLPTMAEYNQLLSIRSDRGAGMSMEAASIAQHCQTLRLAAIGAQFASLAEEASQQKYSHLHYLEALLQAEVEDRERRSIELRLKDARLPRMKTLEEFDFAQSPHILASRIRTLAEGGYLKRSEPVLLVGEPGTGKTHLATGLAIAACRQRKRVRFTTAAALVNQLVEAQREQSLSRMLARWSRVELIVIDELGYVPLAEVAAELLDERMIEEFVHHLNQCRCPRYGRTHRRDIRKRCASVPPLCPVCRYRHDPNRRGGPLWIRPCWFHSVAGCGSNAGPAMPLFTATASTVRDLLKKLGEDPGTFDAQNAAAVYPGYQSTLRMGIGEEVHHGCPHVFALSDRRRQVRRRFGWIHPRSRTLAAFVLAAVFAVRGSRTGDCFV